MIKYIFIFIVLFVSGCTVNGKSIDQIMDKNISSSTQEKEKALDTNKSNFPKIHLKWANKEYHNGEEDINFNINTKKEK